MNTYFKPARAFSRRASAAFAAQIRHHQQLLKIVRASLPPALAEQVKDCVVTGRKLLIYTDSAMWASQLRFHSSAVSAAVNTAIPEFVQVIVTRILPPIEEQYAPLRKAQLPSVQQIENLRNTAQGIADESLRSSLERLGATLRRIYDATARGD